MKFSQHPDKLTARQEKIIREVIERSHAYYMQAHAMPKPCMWPDELMEEITRALSTPGPQPEPIEPCFATTPLND